MHVFMWVRGGGKKRRTEVALFLHEHARARSVRCTCLFVHVTYACTIVCLSPVSLLYLALRSSRSGKNLCRERLCYIGIVFFFLFAF